MLERKDGNHLVVEDDTPIHGFGVVAPVIPDPTHEVTAVPIDQEAIYNPIATEEEIDLPAYPDPYPADPGDMFLVPPVLNQGTTEAPDLTGESLDEPVVHYDSPEVDPAAAQFIDASTPLAPIDPVVVSVPDHAPSTDVVTSRGRVSKQNPIYKDIDHSRSSSSYGTKSYACILC